MDRAPAQKTLGRYELFESLGRGSVFEAFRAKSFGVEGFEKTLVVKRVLPALGASDAFVVAFLEHMQRAMRLSHANLAQVFDLGRDEQVTGSIYFIATEYVSGCDVATLVSRCQARGELPPLALATYMVLEVAKALDHAHRRKDEQMRPLGILHGAIAPHNVVVSFDGDVKLTDFGVTRSLLTLPGPRPELVRAYPAISPEQAAGEEPTVSSDVFSLGTLLYFLITGTQPYAAATSEEILAKVRAAAPSPLEPKRSGVPGPLADLVQKALARHPEERFRTVSAMYEELLACTYACGLRCSPADLGNFVDGHREPGPPAAAQDFDELLSRPLTQPPPPLAPAIDESVVSARPTSIPPLTGFGELRHVSALVLSLAGAERVPEEAWARLRAVVARYGGVLVHEDEGEAVALFGLDRSDGRDTEAAVRAGLVLVRGLESVRLSPSVGVDAGRLRLSGGDEPIPDDRAMRLIDSARGLAPDDASEVVVSRRVASSLRGRFPLEPRGDGLRVKEFAQERFGDAFVGRKSELIHLAETLVRAARGELRIISIVGDPGIGKTRLAVEMQQRLGRGPMDLATYFATCSPRGRELPYSGITVMLRRICGVRDGDPQERVDALEPRLRALGLDSDEVSAVQAELGGAVATVRTAASTALRSAVTRMLHSLSEDRFTVIVWDDAHELDAASSDLLSRAASRLSASRVALVFCARPDPGAPYQVLEANSELRLGEMDAADVEQLVQQRAALDEVPPTLLSFLRERAGGQPMFVEELLRQLVDGGHVVISEGRVVSLGLGEGVVVPRTLRALTSDRLRRLKDDERHLFVAAAVLEPPVDRRVLAAMLDLPFAAVDSVAEALIADGLLARDGSSQFGFPLPLAREVVINELDPGDLVKLHRKAADAHASVLRSAGDGEADRIGYHLAAAGDRDGAAELYAKSGVYYLGARQLDRSALDLAYALDLVDLEKRSSAQIGNWLRALSTSVRYVRTGADLPALIERLVARVDDERMDVAQRTSMRIDLASMLGALNQELAAEALLDRGAAAARHSPELIAGLLAARADLASTRGEFRFARRALDPLSRMTIADKVERHRITLSMARTLGASGQADAANVALDDATRLASRDDPLLALDRAVVRIVLYEYQGKWREAADAAVQAATQAEELGLYYEVASCLSEQAAALARAGEFARAEGVVASALAAADELRAVRLLLRAGQVQSYLHAEAAGDDILDLFRGHVADAESHGWISDALLGRHFLGLLALRLGARDEARRELLLASRIATSTGNQAFADQSADELART
jgi:serine/threonine protein kinase